MNSNWALETLVGENYSGMMDSVPGPEEEGEAGQRDQRADEEHI